MYVLYIYIFVCRYIRGRLRKRTHFIGRVRRYKSRLEQVVHPRLITRQLLKLIFQNPIQVTLHVYAFVMLVNNLRPSRPLRTDNLPHKSLNSKPISVIILKFISSELNGSFCARSFDYYQYRLLWVNRSQVRYVPPFFPDIHGHNASAYARVDRGGGRQIRANGKNVT